MNDKKWKVKKGDGNIYGPADTETFKRWIQENRILAEDYVSAGDSEEWKKPAEINEFSSLFAEKKTSFLLPKAQPRTLTTQVVSDGWQVLKANLFPIVGTCLLYLVISIGVYLGLRPLTFIRLFVSHLIAGPLIVGWSWYCLCKIRKQEISTVALFDGFKVFLPAIGAYFFITVFTLLGFIALIIPGIILLSAYSLAYFFMIDKKMGPWQAMKASFDITKGYRWRVLAVIVLCGLINILGILCLGIGFLVTAPLTTLALAALYERLNTGNIHEFQKQTKRSEIGGVVIPAVAIIIIGMLAAILLPAFLKGRENAIRVIRDANKFIPAGKPLPAGLYTDRKYREIEALEKTGGSQAVELLISALKDEDMDIPGVMDWGHLDDFLLTEEALVRIGKPAVKPLIVILKDKDNNYARRKVIKILGKIGDNQAVKPLIAALQDEDWDIRWRAAKALGDIGDSSAIEPLTIALKDKDRRVRYRAVEALEKIGTTQVIETLEKPGDSRVIEPLNASLKDEDVYVQQKVIWALKTIAGEDFSVYQKQKWLEQNQWEMQKMFQQEFEQEFEQQKQELLENPKWFEQNGEMKQKALEQLWEELCKQKLLEQQQLEEQSRDRFSAQELLEQQNLMEQYKQTLLELQQWLEENKDRLTTQ